MVGYSGKLSSQSRPCQTMKLGNFSTTKLRNFTKLLSIDFNESTLVQWVTTRLPVL